MDTFGQSALTAFCGDSERRESCPRNCLTLCPSGLVSLCCNATAKLKQLPSWSGLFIFSFTHCILVELRSAPRRCGVQDFDVIAELSEESLGAQCRRGPLSVTGARAHLETPHSKSHWWMQDRTTATQSKTQISEDQASSCIAAPGSGRSHWDHKFEKLIFIGTESYAFVIERPRGMVLGKWGPALVVVLVLSEAIWVITGTFCTGLRERCGIIMCCLWKALKRIQVPGTCCIKSRISLCRMNLPSQSHYPSLLLWFKREGNLCFSRGEFLVIKALGKDHSGVESYIFALKLQRHQILSLLSDRFGEEVKTPHVLLII